MPEIYNIYCDESCHLEHDHQPLMLLGGVWCRMSDVKKHNESIREIKKKHGARGELKWNKVSKSKQNFYLELVEFFFSTPGLNFRCLVVDDKSKLDHSYFNFGSHDSFYYKMYFFLLRNILSPKNHYNIYLDMKDTRSQRKIDTLKEVLCNNVHDFEKDMIQRLQHIRSHEVELLQLADFLLGAISYCCRGLRNNSAKVAVVQKVRALSGLALTHSTPPWEGKFNLFFFSPKEIDS